VNMTPSPACYCTPSGTNSSYYIAETKTTNALQNLNHTETAASPNGYGDFTGTDTLVVYPGQIFQMSLTGNNNSMKYYVWADLDRNYHFDNTAFPTGELIAASSGYMSPPFQATLTVPSIPPAALPFITRIRVRAAYITADDPCVGTGSAETDDYILKVV